MNGWPFANKVRQFVKREKKVRILGTFDVGVVGHFVLHIINERVCYTTYIG